MGSERHSKKTNPSSLSLAHNSWIVIIVTRLLYMGWFWRTRIFCMTWPQKSQRVTCGRDSEIPSKERKEITEWAREVCYTRLPGQDTTVSVTLFFCSLSIGMREELFIPTVVAPFTATISSPHLRKPRDIFVIRVGAEKMQERMM